MKSYIGREAITVHDYNYVALICQLNFFPNKQVKKRQTDGTSFNNIFILLNVSQLLLFQRKFH